MTANIKDSERLIIYQMFPRIFSNTNSNCVPWGSYEENGSGKLNDITINVIKKLKDLGINCIWVTGIIEMATKTAFDNIPADNPNVVKGEAGSPYAIKDYYDIAPSLATDLDNRMEEFESLVRRIHSQYIKVIIDFVPNHTARIYHSDVAPSGIKDFGADDDIGMFFKRDNNYYYITNQKFCPDFDINQEGTTPYIEFPAKATGNDCFTAFCRKTDWYETVKLNYGYDPGSGKGEYEPIPETWLKMLHIMRFWASKGIDGFRCDMVFMVPVEFWHWAIPQVKKDYPDFVFIGEIYDINQYRTFLDYCKFDYLYDKVNLYDTLVGIERYHTSAAQLTSCWQTIDGIGNRMLNFLENHDEVRFASEEFAGKPEKVIPYMIVSSMMTKGPFLIYYGQELGESAKDNEGFAGDNNRTTIFDYWSVDTLRRWYNNGKCTLHKLTAHEKWLRNFYKKVLTLCNSNDIIRTGNFFDLMYVNLRNPGFNPHTCYSFIRYTEQGALLFLINFGSNEENISLNIPELCFQMADLKEGNYTEKDILWDKEYIYVLRQGIAVNLTVPACNALILPIKVKGNNNK